MFSMRGGTLRAGVVVGAFLLGGCGGSSRDAKSAADGERGSVGESSERAAPLVLTPAAAPAGVVAKMRVKNMAAIADSVMEAASVPLNWRRLLEKSDLIGPYANVIDWEGSIEGVMAMNVRQPDSPHGAVSIGVTGVDAVLALLEGRGISAFEGHGEVHYFEMEGEDCAVGAAIAGSSARVVCSERRSSLDLLLPYSLRGLPNEPLSSADMHAEFDMEPLRAAYGKELKTYLRWAPAAARAQHQGNPIFDRALSDGAAELAREATALIDELQRVTIQVTQKEGDFQGTLSLTLKGEQSDSVKVLRDLASRQDKVPAIFDQIPSTASTAGFAREISEQHAKKWTSILADLIQGAAELKGASKPFSTRLSSVVREFCPQGKTTVFARGPLVSSQVGGEAKLHPAWVLSGTTRSKSQVDKTLADIAWLVSSPEVHKVAGDVPFIPKFARKHVAIPGAPGASVYEWHLSPEQTQILRMLGAQTDLGVERDEAVESPSTGLIAVHEVGGGTWISWGETSRELAESFRALTNKDIEKLSTLGSLAGVRSEPAVGAGFSKLDGLVGMTNYMLPLGLTSDWDGVSAALPGRGKTPVVYFFTVNEASDTTTASFLVRVPAEFTQDLAALSVMAAQELGKLPGAAK